MGVERPTRFSKQERFQPIGQRGQQCLASATVLVAGLGALGGTMAMLLARAGVGRLLLVDPDRIELSNLHRQLLYSEKDAQDDRAKAIVAGERLAAINSEVKLVPMVLDINEDNLTPLLDQVDLVMDGLDNYKTRYHVNRQAVEQRTPWMYCGVLGARGNVMLIRPGVTPCLHCLYPNVEQFARHPSVDQLGIIGPNPAFAASWAVSEAFKYLIGDLNWLAPGLFQYDLWQNRFDVLQINKGPVPNCPVCGSLPYHHPAPK